MAIREGRWDCPSCGSTAIYGRHVDCPGCGKPRPQGVRFYLTDNAPVVTDPERLREALAGADWICEHCEASNRATLSHCGGCGAGRDAADPVQPVREHAADEIPRTGDARPPAENGAGGPGEVPPLAVASTSPSAPVASSQTGPGEANAPPRAATPASAPPAAPGTDWICQQCEAANPPTLDRCGGCGAFRGTRNPLQKLRRRAGDASAPLSLAGGGSGGTGRPPRRVASPWKEPGMPLRRRTGWAVAGGAGILAVVAMLRALSRDPTPEPVPAVVESVTWERRVVFEARSIVAGEGWELPDSAMEVEREQRVREYRKEVSGYRTVTREVPRTERVLQGYREETRTVDEHEQTGTRTYVCGSRDMGNGYFQDVECSEPEYGTVTRTERVSVPVYEDVTRYETVSEQEPIYVDVPVMAAYFTYRVPQWTPVDSAKLAGTWMTPPEWPAAQPDSGQREGGRDAQYLLTMRDAEGKRYSAAVAEDEFAAYRPGQRVAFAPIGGRRWRDAVLPADSLSACKRWHRGRGKPPPDSLGCSPRRR
jgi:hypothetical protein